MTCPRCKCEECRRVELQAVLGRHVARETSLDEVNAETLRRANEQLAWGDTWPDPAADKLAADVLDDLARFG